MTKRDKTRQPGTPGKKLRDQEVIRKRMEGKKTQAIADEMGMSRQKVSEILNSEQVKKLITQIDNQLASGIEDAVQTVLAHVKFDYDAAYDLLKNFGSMKTNMTLEHKFPKAVVIKRPSGEQVILGTEQNLEDEKE